MTKANAGSFKALLTDGPSIVGEFKPSVTRLDTRAYRRRALRTFWKSGERPHIAGPRRIKRWFWRRSWWHYKEAA